MNGIESASQLTASKELLGRLSAGWTSEDAFKANLAAFRGTVKAAGDVKGVVALAPRIGLTAVLDAARNEFSLTSLPGEMAVFEAHPESTPTHCLVAARDVSKAREVDSSSTVKYFVIPLVNKNGTPASGLTLVKMGPSSDPTMFFYGLNFDNLRLPMEAMLDDGHQGSKAQLALRAIDLRERARDVAAASTIALRYALQNGSLATRMQQHRLLPQVANAFVFLTASAEMESLNNQLARSRDPLRDARELELLASGLKAITSRAASVGIEQCLLSCTPMGLFPASGLPQILAARNTKDALDGDNLELLKELGKSLMEVAALVRAGEGGRLGVGAGYLAESYCFNPRLFDPTRPDHVVPVFEQVARTLVFRVFDHVNNLRAKERVDEATALDRASVDILKAARAHARVFLVRALFSSLASLPEASPSMFAAPRRPLLADLAFLFVIGEILDNDYKFHKDSQLNDSQLDSLKHRFYGLLSSLAPHSRELVDAFAVPKECLGNSNLLQAQLPMAKITTTRGQAAPMAAKSKM